MRGMEPSFEASGAATSRVSGAAAVRTDTVHLVDTGAEHLRAAAPVAATLARALGARLVVVRCAPAGTGDPGGLVKTALDVAAPAAAGVELDARVYTGPLAAATIPFAFRPRSLIVMGGDRRPWPARSERHRRLLESAGHLVVFVPSHKESVDA